MKLHKTILDKIIFFKYRIRQDKTIFDKISFSSIEHFRSKDRNKYENYLS